MVSDPTREKGKHADPGGAAEIHGYKSERYEKLCLQPPPMQGTQEGRFSVKSITELKTNASHRSEHTKPMLEHGEGCIMLLG